MKYDNVMIDIETLGKAPGCAILSVGAVMFSLEHDHVCEERFQQFVSLTDNILLGLDIDAETLRWWLKPDMNEAANATLPQSAASQMSVLMVLENLTDYIDQHTAASAEVAAWSNGGNFDHPIIAVARKRSGATPPPYEFYHEKCYRTLKDFFKDAVGVVKVAPASIKHSAAADADYQARLLCAYWHKYHAGPNGSVYELPEDLGSTLGMTYEEKVADLPVEDRPEVVQVLVEEMIKEEARLLGDPPTALPGSHGAPELKLRNYNTHGVVLTHGGVAMQNGEPWEPKPLAVDWVAPYASGPTGA